MTSSKVLGELERIDQALRRANPDEAESRFFELIDGLSDSDFLYYRPDFLTILDSPGFAQRSKKRRKRCLDAIASRELEIERATARDDSRGANPEAPGILNAHDLPEAHLEKVSSVLSLVYEKHIFQWDSYEALGLFEPFLGLATHRGAPDEWLVITTAIEHDFYEHSRKLFKKGFDEQVRKGRSQEATSSKATNGLRSFVDVVVSNQAYLTGPNSNAIDNTARLRVARLCQAALAGIFGGFASIRASAGRLRLDGQQLLAQSDPYLWGHAFAYMNSANLSQILGEIDRLAGLDPEPLICALQGIEKVSSSGGVYVPILDEVTVDRGSDGTWPITLRYRSLTDAKHEKLRVRVTLSDGPVSSETARAPIHKELCALSVAQVNPETYAAIRSDVVGYERVVAAGSLDRLASERVRLCVELAIGDLVRASQRDLPLEINFAEAFPLDRDDQVRSRYLVRRMGVLDRTVNLGHGAFIWCSVRRSGKSTAAYYMTRAEGNVAWQTFRPERNEDMILKHALEHAVSKSELPRDFISRVVGHASGATGPSDGGRVLVIDEYEQLFSYLVAKAEDSSIRQNVVIPLLNQLLEFSLNNILIMMGLVPNAHYILMDQNHLAPSVKVSPFPLFEYAYDSGTGEFVELLEKVLTGQVTFDSGFASRVYGETQGHPYLTVELLRHFMGFQIGNKRLRSELHFLASDFDEFRAERFTPRKFALEERNYSFHRNALREALGLGARSNISPSDRWIHFVSWILRSVSTDASANPDPTAMRLELDRLEERATIEVPELVSLGLYDVLREASLANFVSYDEHAAWPTIPLLGRLAAAR